MARYNPTKAYRLSFWSTANLSLPSYANLVKSSPVINGFTYYEYNISAGTSVVTIQGNAIIDEVRLYPATARMTTTTSDPLLGKTSECDENNRITYYEYDALGRMKLIKDENRHIVKMYEYGKAKQKGCPGNYSNAAIDVIFTKNDCGVGYVGTEVHYYPPIPAGKYTSDVSQEEVDAQVEAELGSLGQAYANTNGSCIQIWKNTQRSKDFTTEVCENGSIGGTVTYVVPAGKYSSLIDQQHADQMAIDEIDMNGQAYANAPANRVCISTTNPIWEAGDGAPTYCIDGVLWVLMTNINFNSPTFRSTTLIKTEQTCTTNPGGGVKDCQILHLRSSSNYSLIGSSIKVRNNDTIDFNLIIKLQENGLDNTAWRNGVHLLDVPQKCLEDAIDNVPDTNPRTIPVLENGRLWNIIIAPDRSFTVKLINGEIPINQLSLEWSGWYRLYE